MQTRQDLQTALQEAASAITAAPELIPPEGIRMGYALHGARSLDEVCGLVYNPPLTHIETDPAIARVILTIIRHDGCLRSAASLRCTRKILECITDDLALDACRYGAAPPGSGTMDWGVESCCKQDVPDVIYGPRMNQNGAILWMIAETPADVARNIIMLSGCITYTSL